MLLVVVPWTELGTDIAAAVAHNPFEVLFVLTTAATKPPGTKQRLNRATVVS